MDALATIEAFGVAWAAHDLDASNGVGHWDFALGVDEFNG